MECGFSPCAYRFVHFDQAFGYDLFPVRSLSNWPVDLARLRSEKDFLENGLANCVTYLHVLSKKQARIKRLLNADPSPARKKRKKIQQSHRELDNEIKSRRRGEKALLSNLQACKVNLYIAEGVPYIPTPLSSPIADYPSSAMQCSYDTSEPTDISWNGWTNEATSPFAKQASNPLFAHEVVPDEIVGDSEHEAFILRDTERPRSHIDDGGMDVLPNTAKSHRQHSMLSPVAAAFEPRKLHALEDTERLVEGMKKLLVSSSVEKERIEAVRRVTDVGLQRLSVQMRSTTFRTQIQTWCNTTPQQRYCGNAEVRKLRRSRTNSL
jgi:hypothetical protein